MSNTPSDEELIAELEAAGVAFMAFRGGIGGTTDIWTTYGSQDARKIAEGIRAVLAKWGTPQPVVREPLTCEWTHNDDDGYWDTSCGKAWRFDDGGPKENNMNFCHCCGKTLSIKGKEAVNADT